MKTLTTLQSLIFATSAIFLTQSCVKNTKSMPGVPVTTYSYTQVNLVSDTKAGGGAYTDPALSTPYGIAFGPGPLWLANNGSGTSTVYDSTGLTIPNFKMPVTIPSPTMSMGGTPTGIVFSGASAFTDPNTMKPVYFIFVNEDGVISAWEGGTGALKVVDNSAMGAIYKGLTIASVGMANFIYVANFPKGTIEVYDQSFKTATGIKNFVDPMMPAGYAPFDIQTIGSQLFVAYAKQNTIPDANPSVGKGNGYISVFNTDGTFVKEFAAQGSLNAPWGMVQAPASFGQGANAVLIGNFGDGTISVFDSNGSFKGQLQTGGKAITIQNLWGLTFAPSYAKTDAAGTKLFFAAAIDGGGPVGQGAGGLVGYLKANKVTTTSSMGSSY